MQHDFKNAHILIIGDVMLDRYWSGQTSRISPEAPVPVVRISDFEERAGGSGNVALNVTALGAHASLIALTGQDDNAHSLERLLAAKGVNCFFQKVSAPTITKLRVLSQHQQLIRLDFEDEFHDMPTNEALTNFDSELAHCNAVIFSDYGKGTLSDIQTLIKKAKKANKPILIDPKGTDFDRYQHATVITPNFKEFVAVVGPVNSNEELVEKATTLIQRLDIEALLITRGESGMSLIKKQGRAIHIPTRAQEVFDVTGAGDTVIASLGLALATGYDLRTGMNIANAAAGIVVGKLGTSTVTVAELEHALQDRSIPPLLTGIVNEDELLAAVKLSQSQGESIVMTNGCFDILHAGHIDYLQKARAKGDRLIIAINDDASIQRLKGPSRPIVPLAQRMQLLNALQCVDWVVPFSEDTPERLISVVLPDILIKGSDYQVHEIAGSQQVLANGGDVLTLDLVPGCSTSAIVKKIQEQAS
ncbi:bifunctional D-glycero-beta-D-manno-heptose-7-phosphate kinase/D-glycero-beta-D-manno-heptose 1-phosphate adenylyltransferase HldE [Piscirickettsia salmonis]|uniref:bifunctional D-glycero-beta-D-manno-heptose-7-phosphate kinase/D-glycero-beta-D-manno-heptose 1-phosphate adenylyltransferase HldE n=1 Tax=Piscirickettsia salmonis TaxID=1238 RepID=UPI0007C993DD|nr:Bifunctional protein HldE [Piscirickettsiaceae bacterium NZ-RLO1]